MDRRAFVGLLGVGSLAPMSAAGQQLRKVPLIAILWHEASAKEEDDLGFRPALFDSFRRYGYTEGVSARFEERFPGSIAERYDQFARELVALRPDVLLAVSEPSAVAAHRVTTTIPIVFVAVPDPVEAKLVSTVARPGGNVTGVSTFSADMQSKRVEILREIAPTISRVALLYDRLVPLRADREIAEVRSGAQRLGMDFGAFEATDPSNLNPAFAAISDGGFQAVIIGASAPLYNERAKIAEHAIARKLVTIAGPTDFAQAGVLASYGVNLAHLFGDTPTLVHKVLSGQKPGDIPVQQPTRYNLIINLRTATTIGLSVPPIMLSRADQVIE